MTDLPAESGKHFASEFPPLEMMPPGDSAGRARSQNQSLFNRLVVSMMPLVPTPILRYFAQPYIAGETTGEMLETVRALNQHGLCATVDLLGEFITTSQAAYDTALQYHHILDLLAQHRLDSNISVKLSALGLLIDPALCLTLMQQLVHKAAEVGNFVRIDMEDSACTENTIRLYLALRQEFSNVGIVLQAYLRRTHDDTLQIMAANAGHFRLCKGIYVEPRWLAYPSPELIRRNYEVVLDAMLRQGAYVGIATHDEHLVQTALKLIRHYGLTSDRYEFQMLLGVDIELRDMLVAAGHRVRIYVPFGSQWKAYSLRRLKENPKIAGYILQNIVRFKF